MEINVLRAYRLIQRTNGKIFGVEFIKKNGQLRKMSARLGVIKNIKGEIDRWSSDINNDLLTVFDMNAPILEKTPDKNLFGEEIKKVKNRGNYRRINLLSLRKLTIDGIEYSINGGIYSVELHPLKLKFKPSLSKNLRCS